MQRLLLCITFLFSASSFSIACDCATLKKLDRDDLAKTFPVIFYGKVINFTVHDGKRFVRFSVNEPYVGKLQKEIELLAEASDCANSFDVGEEWLIYAYYWEYGKAETDICAPGRKNFKNQKEDFNLTTRGTTFEQDRDFLIKNFGIQPFLIKNPDEEALKNRELEKPGGYGMVWMILIGTFVLALFYYLFNKFF